MKQKNEQARWKIYERRKRAILKLDLSPDEYADALRRLARRLGLWASTTRTD